MKNLLYPAVLVSDGNLARDQNDLDVRPACVRRMGKFQPAMFPGIWSRVNSKESRLGFQNANGFVRITASIGVKPASSTMSTAASQDHRRDNQDDGRDGL